MEKIRMAARRLFPLLLLVIVVGACNGISEFEDISFGPRSDDPSRTDTGGNGSDGDYVVLKRVRIIDTMGFDKPVEAGSFLLPEGWEMNGGITWKGLNECRGEIVQQKVEVTSPDGAIRFVSDPVRSFVYTDDPSMLELLQVGERSGGCAVRRPFDASQFISDRWRDGGDGNVANVQTDEARENFFREMMQKVYGNSPQKIETTFVQGDLRFDNGDEGIAYIGVMNFDMRNQNYFTGGSTGLNSMSVFYDAYVRFPPERRDEALKITSVIMSSSRTNPIWEKAKSDFLTKLSNIEHAGRMERIRLVGEQSKAYARSRDQAMDEQMRSWERRQASSDASHRRFVKSIREVETWRDSSGDSVDLQSGYKYGFSRPDGSYLLTDDPNFDPAVKFRQDWTKMEKQPD